VKKTLLLALLPFTLAACATLAPDKPKATAPEPTLRLTLIPQDALTPGKPTTVLAKINHIEQRVALTDADLDTVHTMKFHLLVIDPAFSDYQHIHPQPTSTPGVYSFPFIPKSADGYRAWADVTPTLTHKQEFASDDLGTPRKGSIDKTESREATLGNYRFSLSFDKPPVAGGESMGTIRVTGAGGKPVTSLEPGMGAYAHIVGFHEDYRTVIHTHPMGAEPAAGHDHHAEGQGGGPELMFHLSPTKPGFVKLFAQVKIGGREYFAPFGVMVAKAP